MCVSTPSWGKLPARGPTLRVWWMPMRMWQLLIRAGWWGRFAFLAFNWHPHYYKLGASAWGFLDGQRGKVEAEVHLIHLLVSLGFDWSGRE